MRRPVIERMLPAAFQRAAARPGLLVALLEAMEAMHAPDEETLEAVEDLFAPYRAPDRMVGFLLGWVAFDHVLADASSVASGRLRDLLANGAELSRRRGTAEGLRRVIATVTGVPVRVEEPPGREFHVLVRVPASAVALVPLIARLVEAEKPAATTYEVVTGESKEGVVP